MEYVPVRVSTLRGDQKIDFDCYIKIGDRQVLYLRRGDSFEGIRLRRLKEKKLRKMFILPDDEKNYRAYLERNLQEAYDPKSTKDIGTRTEIVQGEQQGNAEAVFESGGDKDTYTDLRASSDKFVQFLQNEKAALGHILKIENLDANIAHHGVTVSTLSVSLAQKLGGFEAKHLSLLATGAMIHDFGHFDSGLNIFRPLKDFSEAEMKEYREHPSKGAQQVQEKKHFEQSVINIIVQHEESVGGKGFPRGFKESEIDPLAVIVGTCNIFDRLITFEKIPIKDAIKRLMIEKVGEYPLAHIQKLADIVRDLP